MLLPLLVVGGLLTAPLYLGHRSREAHLGLRFPDTPSRDRLTISFDGTATTFGPHGVPSSTTFNSTVTEDVTWQPTSVDQNGVATLRLSVSDVRLSSSGRPLAARPGTLSTMIRVAPDGEMLSAPDAAITSGRGAGTGLPGIAQLAPILPTRGVRPGASWTKAFVQEVPFGTGRLPVSATNELVGYQDVKGGMRAAVIRTDFSIPIDVLLDLARLSPTQAGPTVAYSGRASLVQMAWLDARRGRVLKTAGDGTFDLTLVFRGFPSLFPTFEALPAAGAVPFGGGPQGSVPGGPERVQLTGRVQVRLDALDEGS